MEVEIIVKLIFPVTGLLEVGLSIPLVLEKIPPNYYYGFRVEKIYSNKEIWYKVNKYFGRDFLVMGLIVITGSLIMFVLNVSVAVFSLVGLVLLLIPLIIDLFRAFNYLSKL